MNRKLNLGIDVGSTTIKLVYLNEQDEIVYSKYERHFSDVKTTLERLLKESFIALGSVQVKIVSTGSGAMEIASLLKTQICTGSYCMYQSCRNLYRRC